MSVGFNWCRLLTSRLIFRRASSSLKVSGFSLRRSFGDTPKPDADNKQVMVSLKYHGPQVQGSASEERLRVRRARPTDVPRLLRFVKENSRATWPGGGLTSPYGSQVMLCDYVSRALSQGHSMLAEQHESRRAWSQIRGLAIAAAVCPWDAALLDKFARCIRCTRSKKMMSFTAYCLRAPALHNKYRVHKILQVILFIPPDSLNNKELVQVLAKNIIQRGRDVGFPLLRFDVTNEQVAKALEDLPLKKEWQLSYDIIPDKINEDHVPMKKSEMKPSKQEIKEDTPKGHFIAVYSALTKQQECSKA